MFSNGTEYEIFMERFCYRCSKYKSDKEGIPYDNSCNIEKKIFESSFDSDKFPKDNVYWLEKQGHICNKYKDKIEQKQQKQRKVKQIDGQIALE